MGCDILDRLPEADDDSAEDISCWKNLIFLKNGKTLWGAHTFSTREAATVACIAGDAELRRLVALHPTGHVISRKQNGAHLFFFREFSHAIPMPWKPEE